MKAEKCHFRHFVSKFFQFCSKKLFCIQIEITRSQASYLATLKVLRFLREIDLFQELCNLFNQILRFHEKNCQLLPCSIGGIIFLLFATYLPLKKLRENFTVKSADKQSALFKVPTYSSIHNRLSSFFDFYQNILLYISRSVHWIRP